MTKSTCLASLMILACHYVCGIVLQSPQTISRPAVNSVGLNSIQNDGQQGICLATGSDSANLSATSLSFTPELPPEGLFVEFQYTPGGMMSKHDIWIAITRAITDAAIQHWNAMIVGTIQYPVVSNVRIIFVSSVEPPRYHSKTIIWTLMEVFNFVTLERHYSNSFFKTFTGTGSARRNLGVASIKSTLSSDLKAPTNSSVLGLSNVTALNLDPSDQVSDRNISTLQANSRRLTIVLDYLENGATFSDKGFFNIIITLLTFGAQHDPKNAPSGVLSAYNQDENYTLTIEPTSYAARGNLPWGLALPALGYLPAEMLKQRPAGRWAELEGRVKLDGAYIGKIHIVKGRNQVQQADLCGNAALHSIDTGSNGNNVE